MRKVLIMLLASTSVLAQKADITSNKVKWPVDRPDYLKTIKTFSYEIQDDGKYWNYEPNPEHFPEDTYPNLASLTDGISIDGLESVGSNADLKIIAGFLGNQLKMDNGLIRLDGTLNLMIVVHSNKLLNSLIEDVQLSVVVNPDKYPLETPNHRNQTKARILTAHIQELIDELNYLFINQPEVSIPLGVFEKAKTNVTETFNTNSKTFIERIQESPSDKSLLDEAITYWKSQIEVDFGKSMKDKIKDKVIYVNLTSASILKGDMDSAKKYHLIVKENSGFFDSWTVDYDKLFKKTDYINELKNRTLPSINVYPNLAYYITIDQGGIYTFKDKETKFWKIEIERFIPTVQSGIGSLDSYRKPRVVIYYENGSMMHNGGNQSHIITDTGMEIFFKVENGDFKPHIKQNDGNYIIYNGY